MTRMSTNSENSRRDCGQLATDQLNFRLRCNLLYDTINFVFLILGSLVETDKYIKVSDGQFFTAKQTGEVKRKCVTTMENPLLLRYRTYYSNQDCAIDYFSLPC